MQTEIAGIASYLPGEPVSNATLAANQPDWDINRIAAKTGILTRHLAAPDECSSDLAVMAAERLFASGICSRTEIDFVLLCTQSPDYLLPTTACLLQDRLGIATGAGAVDINLGCSGYIYGLGLAQGLLCTGQASRVLLITADTYSKFIKPTDRSSASIFGDAATATFVRSVPSAESGPSPVYVYGTDGSGAQHLIVRRWGMRAQAQPVGHESGSLHMNGPEIFRFAMKVVPACITELLARCGRNMEDIDLFVLHQANQYMLENLRVKLNVPLEKFYISMSDCGNTVSGTIPIALERAQKEGRLRPGDRVVLVGFGVGLSWGATLLSWPTLGDAHT